MTFLFIQFLPTGSRDEPEITEYLKDEELLEEIKKSGGYKMTKEKAHSSLSRATTS